MSSGNCWNYFELYLSFSLKNVIHLTPKQDVLTKFYWDFMFFCVLSLLRCFVFLSCLNCFSMNHTIPAIWDVLEMTWIKMTPFWRVLCLLMLINCVRKTWFFNKYWKGNLRLMFFRCCCCCIVVWIYQWNFSIMLNLCKMIHSPFMRLFPILD